MKFQSQNLYGDIPSQKKVKRDHRRLIYYSIYLDVNVFSLVRINVTFRYSRPVYLENNPQCFCGFPTILRTVVKKQDSKNLGSYFYSCGGRKDDNSNKNSSSSSSSSASSTAAVRCEFFQWLDLKRINKLDLDRHQHS